MGKKIVGLLAAFGIGFVVGKSLKDLIQFDIVDEDDDECDCETDCDHECSDADCNCDEEKDPDLVAYK